MGKIRTSKRTHSKRKSLKRNNFHLKGGSTGAKGIKYEPLFKKTLEFYDNEFKSVAIESYSFKAENIGFKNGGTFRYYEGEEKYFKTEYMNDGDFDKYINTIQEKINKWNECLNVETEVPDVEVTTQKTKPEKLFIYSDSHGIYNETYGTVPDNIVVCLLTRIGQYGFALNTIDAMKPILSIIDFNESEFETLFANKIKNTTEVFDNKINKWKQKNFNNCFQYSSWYYPGQTFDDLDLVYDGSAESLGIYFFKTDKKDKKNVARKDIKNKNEYHEGDGFAYYKTKFGTETTLANLLTTLQKNFLNKKILITIECCRKMEKIESDQIKIHADFYTQIINNYFINNQNIEPGKKEHGDHQGSLHFPGYIEHSDIFKKPETVPVTGDNLNNVDKLLKANVKGLPEVKPLDYEEIKDERNKDIEKLKKEIKIYTSLKKIISHLNNLIAYNNALGIIIKGLRDSSDPTDYSILNNIKTKIDSLKVIDSFNEETKKKVLRNVRTIYNMFIEDTSTAKDTSTDKDAKIKIAREGIIKLIDSTFREELLIINPNLIAILNEANLNITLKTFEAEIPPDPTTTTNPKVSVLKNNLNMFTENIKPYMEVLNENYEKKYIEVRKTLRDIVLTTTYAEFYIKYDLPIRGIPFDEENKLLKKLGATITKLEIIDVFFYNGIPLRYTEDYSNIEMDISKIFETPSADNVTYKFTDLNVYEPENKDTLLTKIKNSGGFFIKVKRAPAGAGDSAGAAPATAGAGAGASPDGAGAVPAQLLKAYTHFFKKDERDIKIAQNKLLMNIKKDIQKEIDNIKIKESVDNDYKATKDIFDNLKLIYTALGHSTSSLNEYERDLEILNPGVGYKTIYTNQDVALKQLKKLLELKIKNIMEEISGQSYNDRGIPVPGDNEGGVPVSGDGKGGIPVSSDSVEGVPVSGDGKGGIPVSSDSVEGVAVPNDIKDENILKQDYDLSLEPVKKDYLHETEFHNQDFICMSDSSLTTYIYKKKKKRCYHKIRILFNRI